MIFFMLSLLFLVFVMALTVVMQYRRSVLRYKGLAESLCDPGSWNIRFLIRVVILEGKVDASPIRYSVLGTPQGESLATSYLLLLCPVKRNLRVYAGADLSQVDDSIRTELEVLQQTDGFRSVILTPAASPFLGKLLSRPLGFTYGPGILLCKLGAGAFNAETIKSDVVHLIALSVGLASPPPPAKLDPPCGCPGLPLSRQKPLDSTGDASQAEDPGCKPVGIYAKKRLIFGSFEGC